MFSNHMSTMMMNNMMVQNNYQQPDHRTLPSLQRASSSAYSSSESSSSSSSLSSVSSGQQQQQQGQLKKKKSKAPCKAKTPLPVDFQPTEYTVMCGRSRECFESVGNRRFRVLCNMHLQGYLDAPGKLEKSRIVTKIMNTIRQSSPVGAFVAYENGRYYEVSQRTAREKVGAFFRDSLHTVYRSSAKAKLARKREEDTFEDIEPIAMTHTTTMNNQNQNFHINMNNNTNTNKTAACCSGIDIIDMSLLECIAPVEPSNFQNDGRYNLQDIGFFEADF